VPVAVIRYTEVGFSTVVADKDRKQKTMGETEQGILRLYKTNLAISQNHYWHLFIAFPMHAWFEV